MVWNLVPNSGDHYSRINRTARETRTTSQTVPKHRSANRVGLLLAMPALPGIATQGDTLEEALEMIQASHAISVVFAAITTGTPSTISTYGVHLVFERHGRYVYELRANQRLVTQLQLVVGPQNPEGERLLELAPLEP